MPLHWALCTGASALAENDVRANVGTVKNDGYYQLGLEAAAVIPQAFANGCPVVHTTAVEPAVDA